MEGDTATMRPYIYSCSLPRTWRILDCDTMLGLRGL
jgi:hypothetical protein